MAETVFKHGNPLNVDYTPAAGDIALGQVVLLGTVTANTSAGALVLIASRPIANNIQGALDAGGGVYVCTNLNNAANGAKVYWDDTNNKVTTASTNNATFGQIVKNGAGGANSTCWVKHSPEYGGV